MSDYIVKATADDDSRVKHGRECYLTDQGLSSRKIRDGDNPPRIVIRFPSREEAERKVEQLSRDRVFSEGFSFYVVKLPANPREWLMRNWYWVLTSATALMALVLCSTAHAGDSWSFNSDDREAWVISPWATHYPRMDFPYGDVEARLAYRCRKKNTWEITVSGKRFGYAVEFTALPNLNGGFIGDGFTTYHVRMSNTYGAWSMVPFNQRWGSKILITEPLGASFGNPAKRIDKYLQYQGAYIATLDWYGNSGVSYKFSASGMQSQINRARKFCGLVKKQQSLKKRY